MVASWSKLGIAASHHPVAPGFVSTGNTNVVGEDFLGPRSRAELERGHTASRKYGAERTDADTAELALTYYREHQPRFLFIGLGETDERAHHGNVEGYWGALRFADEFIGRLRAAQIERAQHGARTALLVTTDHGRAHNFRDHGHKFPESARSFLILETRGIDLTSLPHAERPSDHDLVPHHLKDIAPTLRAACHMKHPRDADGRALTLLPKKDEAHARHPQRLRRDSDSAKMKRVCSLKRCPP